MNDTVIRERLDSEVDRCLGVDGIEYDDPEDVADFPTEVLHLLHLSDLPHHNLTLIYYYF